MINLNVFVINRLYELQQFGMLLVTDITVKTIEVLSYNYIPSVQWSCVSFIK